MSRVLHVILRQISNQLVEVVVLGEVFNRFNDAYTEPTTGDGSFGTLVIFVQRVAQFCSIVATEMSCTRRYFVHVTRPRITLSHNIFVAVIVAKRRS